MMLLFGQVIEGVLNMLSRNALSVRLAVRPDGFTPQAFLWEGKLVRVLAVESMRTRGTERRFRVRSAAGRYELSFHADVGLWFVLRGPTRLGRALCQLETMPRYSLPVWRRRSFRRSATVGKQGSRGGGNADGFALV
jgi:hypothetical protein